MVEIWLPYGKTEVHISIPINNLMTTLEPTKKEPAVSNREIVRESLLNPIKAKNFLQLIRTGEKVAIAIDGTINPRTCVSSLNAMLEICRNEEIPFEKITLYIGSIMNETSSKDLINYLRTSDALKNIKISEHLRNTSDLINLGSTSNGTEVTINRAFYESEYKVVLGEVLIDYHSGLRGAQTTMLTGFTGYKTIEQNREIAFKEIVTPGVIEGNVTHLDSMEAANMIGIDLAVNLVCNTGYDLVSSHSGNLEDSWTQAIGCFNDSYHMQVESNADIIVVSAGGSKYDNDLYNAIWALGSIKDIAHRNTGIILIAECRNGLGANGLSTLARIDKLNELRRRYMLGAREVYLIKSIIRSNDLYIVSTLPKYITDPLGLKVERTANDAIKKVYENRRNKRTLVLTHGNTIVPYVKSEGNSQEEH